MIVAYDPAGSSIAVIDTAARRVVRTIAADRPRSIAGSDNSIFVRTAGRGETMVLPYSGLLEGLPVAPRYIAGGDLPSPARAQLPITATADGISAWIDTERGQVYVYHEGMNIPSATLRLPDSTTTDLALIGPLVRPANGTGYAASTRLDRPGEYVAVAKGVEPRYAVCQAFTIAGEGGATRPELAWRVSLTKLPLPIALGAAANFEVAVEPEGSGRADYANTIGLLVMEGSGLGQQRLRATHTANGRYTAQFVPTRPGAFLLMVDRATLPERVTGRLVTAFEVKP